MKTVLLAFVLLALGALAMAGYKALRAYRYEASQFQNLRHKILAPSDAPSLQLQRVEFPLPSGEQVSAWFIPARNGAALAMVHGSPSDRNELLPEARYLAAHGYGALLIDVPGHGESPGQPTWGHNASEALKSAITFLLAQPGITRVGAHGFSCGSAVVARTAAEDPRIQAVVLAGIFTTIEEQLTHEFGQWFPALPFVTSYAAVLAARNSVMEIGEQNVMSVIGKIAPRPILFVAGSNDYAVPEAMTRAVFNAAREPKEMMVVQGAGHGEYALVGGEGFLGRVTAFLDRALLGR